jgi:DNA-binding MarR family transcriptional regulator
VNAALERDVTAFWSILFAILIDGEKRLASHMGEHGLTPPQFFVLKTLIEKGGTCPIGQIARDHHLTSATMTGLVKRLELMEPPLVQRERSPQDGRSINVILTAAGADRFEAVKHSVFEQLQLILGLISEEDRLALMHFLSRYLEVVAQVFPVDLSSAVLGD